MIFLGKSMGFPKPPKGIFRKKIFLKNAIKRYLVGVSKTTWRGRPGTGPYNISDHFLTDLNRYRLGKIFADLILRGVLYSDQGRNES